MATYRGDLEAARTRIRTLEDELAGAKAEIAELRGKEDEPKPSAKPQLERAGPESEPRPRRGIRFEWPASYFPAAKLWFTGLRNMVVICLERPFREPSSGNVVVWLLYQVARPVVFCLRGVAISGLVLTAPYTALNMVIYSVLLLPLILMMSLRFADAPRNRSGWIHGRPDSDGEAVRTYWMLTTFTPLVVPAGVAIGNVARLL